MFMFKNTLRKIKHSLGRFITLILIIAIGAAFFAGVRETSSDMIRTMDEYYDETKLMDYRIVSTMGLTEDDLTALKNLNNTEVIEANYTYETVIDGDATKIYGITHDINNVTLVDGKMPEEDNECLVLDGSYNIGDTIIIEDEDYGDYLKNNTYKVVGTVNSSMYIYNNLGISTVSDGKLDNVIYINKDNFNMDYYTEIYLIAKESIDATSYRDDYEEIITKLNAELEELAPIRETIRYEEIKTAAMEEIYEAREEINNLREENEEKFADAKEELDNAQLQIDNGYKEINNARAELETRRTQVLTELDTNEATLNTNLATINASLRNFGITTSSIDESINALNTEITNLNNLLATLDPTSMEYQTTKETINNLNTLVSSLNEIKNGFTEITNARNEFNNTYNETLNTLNSNREDLDKQQETLNENLEEYNTNYAEFQNKINDGLAEIANAEEKIATLEKPEWYLFDREDNSGYTTFLESATKIDSIAAVFPIFFIAVAFLMCLNTMTRMIEEERTEIGIFTSLGIGKFKIIFSYIFYVLLATLLGLLIGLTIGYTIIPHVLYNVYTQSYIIPGLKTYANIPICISIIEVCIITMTLVTFIAVAVKFKNSPANLLRPASPKNGRKVLLEKINFIWKRISFSWKVTIRNLFRYKKRIIMTLIGISGCTALLLTGFGIKDSISKILDIQYGEIEKYDSMLFLNESVTEENVEINNLLANNNIENPLYAHMETLTFAANNKNIDVYSLAFLDNDISNYYDLLDLDGNPLSLDDEGAIVTEKIADILNVDVGDTITLRDNNNEIYVIKISGISRNYINNYVYMNTNYYNLVFGDISYNTIIANINDSGDTLLASDYFSNIQYTEDSVSTLQDIFDSMNHIVFLIIGFSSVLAITVLYNLTTINISERTREIATLKVLGFNDKEISMYVYRETIILTIIGIIIGLLVGIGLNAFVLTVAETDEIIFIKQIHYLSYILTVVIMIIFTIIVQIITNFILRKVNMIDSLKSVE